MSDATAVPLTKAGSPTGCFEATINQGQTDQESEMSQKIGLCVSALACSYITRLITQLVHAQRAGAQAGPKGAVVYIMDG